MQQLPPAGELRSNEEVSEAAVQRLISKDLVLGKELDSFLTGMQKTTQIDLIEKKEWNPSRKMLE